MFLSLSLLLYFALFLILPLSRKDSVLLFIHLSPPLFSLSLFSILSLFLSHRLFLPSHFFFPFSRDLMSQLTGS